jgi:hypothetical protein
MVHPVGVQVAAAPVASTNPSPLPKHQSQGRQGGGSKQGGTSSKQGGHRIIRKASASCLRILCESCGEMCESCGDIDCSDCDLCK